MPTVHTTRQPRSLARHEQAPFPCLRSACHRPSPARQRSTRRQRRELLQGHPERRCLASLRVRARASRRRPGNRRARPPLAAQTGRAASRAPRRWRRPTGGRKRCRRAPRAAQRKPLPRLEREHGDQRLTAGFSAGPGENCLLAGANVFCRCLLSAVPGQGAGGKSSGWPAGAPAGQPYQSLRGPVRRWRR
jgi:hypothetical protein